MLLRYTARHGAAFDDGARGAHDKQPGLTSEAIQEKWWMHADGISFGCDGEACERASGCGSAYPVCRSRTAGLDQRTTIQPAT